MALKSKSDIWVPIYRTDLTSTTISHNGLKAGESLMISLDRDKCETTGYPTLKEGIELFGKIQNAKVTAANTITFTFSEDFPSNTTIPIQYTRNAETGSCILVGSGGGSLPTNLAKMFVQTGYPGSLKAEEQGIWLNPNNGLLKYWNGTAWVESITQYAVFAPSSNE